MDFLKRNLKKTIFASIFMGNGFFLLKSHYQIEKHMREVCNYAAEYTSTMKSPGHVVTIINPVSSNRNTIKIFQNYCEPILHSAGFSMESIKTCYAGHAKSLIEDMDKLPAAIIVAGGAGTASEVVTGLMRNGKAICPVAILPLGSSNKLPYIFGRLDFVENLTNSVLNVVKGNYESESVMKYDLIEESDLRYKSIYGLNCFKWGVDRDLDVLKEKYWYFGVLKRYAAILFNAFSENLSWDLSADLTYSTPCQGCSNCYKLPIASMSHISKFSKSNNEKKISNSSNINYCNKNHCNVKTSNLTITPQFQPDSVPALLITSFPKLVPGLHSLKSLLDLTYFQADQSLKITSVTVEVTPTSPVEENFFCIDGEEYEVRPIKIAIIPKALQVFK